MLNMIRYEYRRLFQKKSFYICLIITLAVMVFQFLLLISQEYYDYPSVVGDDFGILNYDNYRISGIEYFVRNYSPEFYAVQATNNSGTGSIIFMIVAIFTSIFICEDRQLGTIKNIYSKGYARYQVFLSEFLTSGTAAAMIYISALLLSFILGLCTGAKIGSVNMTEQTNMDWTAFLIGNYSDSEAVKLDSYVLLIFGQLLGILALNGLFIVFAELFKQTGGAIAMNIFIPSLISNGLRVLALIIVRNMDSKTQTEMGEQIFNIFNKWVYSIATQMNVGIELEIFNTNFVLCFVYIAVFCGLGILISSKRQIKG